MTDGAVRVTAAEGTARRFWNLVERGADDECWLWLGAKAGAGYGRFSLPRPSDNTTRPSVAAHRFAYESIVGPIPDGLTLDHLCEVKACVNPAHLEPVTQRENTLRSQIGPSAINARKTHCLRGHEFTPENTEWRRPRTEGAVRRGCRECIRIRRREWRRRKREAKL